MVGSLVADDIVEDDSSEYDMGTAKSHTGRDSNWVDPVTDSQWDDDSNNDPESSEKVSVPNLVTADSAELESQESAAPVKIRLWK